MKVLPFTIPVPHDRTIIVLEEVLPHFYTYLHRHAEVQITWIQQGEGTLLAGNNMHTFQSDEIYLIGANQPHLFKSDPTYFLQDSGKEVRTVTIFFNPAGKLSALFGLPEMKALKTFIDHWQGGFKVPEEHYESVATQIEWIKNGDNTEQLYHFIGLLIDLNDDAGLQPLSQGGNTLSMTDPEGMRIAAVYNYIMHNYNSPLTLNEVAAQAHLTPTAFCRYFKKHTRLTFVHFVNKVRINEACRQLVSGGSNNIAAIAYNCGFNSIPNFNRVFKDITGKSPGQYAKDYTDTIE